LQPGSRGGVLWVMSTNLPRELPVLLELLATLCAGLFAGAAIYITLVEHPARLECGTLLATTEFGPSYRRASLMQASLATLGLVLGYRSLGEGT
jgi:hypothetical protein